MNGEYSPGIRELDNAMMGIKKGDFSLSSDLKNHETLRFDKTSQNFYRGHGEKRRCSVLSVCSVVDQHCSDSFFQNKLKSLQEGLE